jgi:cystathionine beta-lyase
MWVADMDFRSPPEVVEAIKERAQHGMFGYTTVDEEYYTEVARWWQRRHGWNVKHDWIVTSPGTISALSVAVRTFTSPGDGIIIQPPVYPPFERTIRLAGRQVLYNQLMLNNNGRYTMNLGDLDKQLSQGAKMFIFCSPHNPVGRVWTKEELKGLADVLSKYEDVVIFDDELWADFVFPSYVHHPLLNVAPELAKRTVTATSVSKTFNLAGLENTNLFIPDEQLRKTFREAMFALALNKTNLFAIVATKAAYSWGEPWLDLLLEYLQENLQFIKTFLQENLPTVSVIEPEGTYLAWFDIRQLHMSCAEVSQKLLHDGKVAVEEGTMFGPGGEGFLRVNYAMPRTLLKQALEGMSRALAR